MKHQFSQVPKANIQRSSFDRSHGVKTTFDGGYLVPFYVDEALPGDTFNCNVTAFARLATPIKPVMDNMYMETFFFAVPCRLLWDGWKAFMGEETDPGDHDPLTNVVPKIDIFEQDTISRQSGGLWDHLGVPIYAEGDIRVNALPARAYNLIWNEWFRDQNLQESIHFTSATTDEPGTLYELQRRGKRHDYFTSCLPWQQKGPRVTIPTLDQVPILPDPNYPYPVFMFGDHEDNPGPFGESLRATQGSDNAQWTTNANESGDAFWYAPNLIADLTDATAVSVNDLRVAFQFQKLLERDARGGTRYTEVIRAHFGVTSPDARQQRPEFLGGGSTPVNIKPVEQTSDTITASTTPQGNLAAYGTANLMGHGFTKSFTEHSYIIGLVNVRADLTYSQGINRLWLRDTKYDWYWPALAEIGEQIVWDDEIYAKNLSATFPGYLQEGEEPQLPTEPFGVNNVFGYQERWAEYRYKPSEIHGRFRSEDPLSLDIWHLSQDFENLPLLNAEFIEDTPPIDRVIAVQDEPHFLFDAHVSLRCARPMPLYSVPGNIDRF